MKYMEMYYLVVKSERNSKLAKSINIEVLTFH